MNKIQTALLSIGAAIATVLGLVILIVRTTLPYIYLSAVLGILWLVFKYQPQWTSGFYYLAGIAIAAVVLMFFGSKVKVEK